MAMHWLPGIIQTFREECPEVNVDIRINILPYGIAARITLGVIFNAVNKAESVIRIKLGSVPDKPTVILRSYVRYRLVLILLTDNAREEVVLTSVKGVKIAFGGLVILIKLVGTHIFIGVGRIISVVFIPVCTVILAAVGILASVRTTASVITDVIISAILFALTAHRAVIASVTAIGCTVTALKAIGGISYAIGKGLLYQFSGRLYYFASRKKRKKQRDHQDPC
jgi:hypothetical protein